MLEKERMLRSTYNALQKELEELETKGRAEVAEEIKEARSYGDISENAEYDAAQQKKAELEDKIAGYKDRLANVEIIEDEDLDTDSINVGLTARVRDLDLDEEEEFAIVSSSEINPEKNMISSESPIGKELSGKRVGDIVEVLVPEGAVIRFEVLDIFKTDMERNRNE